jgi:hypothetical protein
MGHNKHVHRISVNDIQGQHLTHEASDVLSSTICCHAQLNAA